MSLYDKMATAAMLYDNIQNPPTHIVTRVSDYNVAPTNNAFIGFTGSISRLDVKFNTGGPGIGTLPYRITLRYRTRGFENPEFVKLAIGIRKASDDSFVLIAEHPIEGSVLKNDLVREEVVFINNAYEMEVDDKISIEKAVDDTKIVELATGTGAVSGFTSQQYTGSYGTTTNPIAVTVTMRKLVPI